MEEAIIVEGKYDKIKVAGIVNAMIIETNGFRIFKDKKKLDLIRSVAESRGIIILTDSDAAGFLIRNYLRGAVISGKVKHAYIPNIFGKEKRKRLCSKEGKLGVEGFKDDIILSAIQKCSCKFKELINDYKINKTDLYNAKLTGYNFSKKLRRELLLELNLPEYFSTNSLIEFINYASNDGVYNSILKKYNLSK